MGCLLTSLTAMRDWSCTSSHNTPSKIEQREFYNGILMLSQKQRCMTNPCIVSSWREADSPVLRRSALDGAVTGTLWLSILSFYGSLGYELRPTTGSSFISFSYAPDCTCPVASLHRSASVLSDTIPFTAYSSVNVLFRHTVCLQSESLPVLVDRELCDRVCHF